MGTPDSSMPSDTFRTGAHVTLAPVRIWHPETNEQRHEQSPAAVRMPPGRAQPVFTILLPREPADRITKRQHAPRAALRRADSDLVVRRGGLRPILLQRSSIIRAACLRARRLVSRRKGCCKVANTFVQSCKHLCSEFATPVPVNGMGKQCADVPQHLRVNRSSWVAIQRPPGIPDLNN